MSHKDKICSTAVASHIESCHRECSYTPLIIKEGGRLIPNGTPIGLSSIVYAEIDAKTEKDVLNINNDAREAYVKSKQVLEDIILSSPFGEANEKIEDNIEFLSDNIENSLKNEIEAKMLGRIEETREMAAKELGEVSDLTDPELALHLRSEKTREMLNSELGKGVKFENLNLFRYSEHESLGLFFDETTCLRKGQKTYEACGEEFSILPNESISQRNILKSTLLQETDENHTTSEELTTTDRSEATESFTQVYDEKLKKETDVKLSKSTTTKLGIPLKIFSLDFTSTGSASIDFKKIMEESSTTTQVATQERFNEAIRELSTSSAYNASSSLTTSSEAVFERDWRNETDEVQTFIKRKGYCKSTVIQRRNNVRIAWSGCINGVGDEICTPANIEENHSSQIQAIRESWNKAPAPSSMGPRPSSQKVCTTTQNLTNRGNIFQSETKFDTTFTYTVPSGWIYEIGSASLTIVATNSEVHSINLSQPSSASSSVSFEAIVYLKNKIFHEEEVSANVCFNIIPIAAAEWDQQLASWRNEQAQKEIDALLEDALANLGEFLLSDQLHATYVRLIMEKYFAVNPTGDCCKLIAKLHKVFDWDMLCQELLPIWNATGNGCQSSEPVNALNAECIHFKLPINEGFETEALAMLAAVNAIPYTSQLHSQYAAYIWQVQNWRATKYGSVFDPSNGWDVRFDRPNEYQMTPFNTTDPDWASTVESQLNHEIVGAHIVNIPCPGFRIDRRPQLCG